MKQWQQYQQDTASLFKKLGLSAEVEAKVPGVRGAHDVDVLVNGSLHGIEFTWIVECKDWKSNIPKEKVMALVSIVEDIGADRGFLLSEIGFQSGAIRQAENRNITLTSLQDLMESAAIDACEQALAQFAWRVSLAKKEIWRRHYPGGKYLTEYHISAHWFYLDYLSEVFDESTRGKYPIVYKFDSVEKLELKANNLNELLAGIETVLSDAERFLNKN